MDEQINRTILDNFDVSSVENAQHEIYKMSGTEVLKGLENGSLHFITVPREEFIDHTLLPEYITSHGFVIDTMLDGSNGTNNESLQQAVTSYITHHSGHTLVNTNEIQLQSNIDESDKRLSVDLMQFVKGGNVRIGGANATESQVIVTNKDLVNFSGTQIIDTTLKNDNSNHLDTSTFLTFNDDQTGLSSSLMNDGQFKIFQQPSPITQQPHQHIQITSANNSSLVQVTPIRKQNRSRKNSVSLNNSEQINIDRLKNNNEVEHIQNFQQRPAAKRVLPHKKRITKKLKSIDGNQKVDILFQQTDNLTKPESSEMRFFTDLNDEINAVEVINLNPTPQFSCQICGISTESQLDFFSHLKLHYEPKPEVAEMAHVTIIRDPPTNQKELVSHPTELEPQIQVSVSQQPQQSSQFEQLSLIKRQNQIVQQRRTNRNPTSPAINENSHFQHLPQGKRQQYEQQNQSDHQTRLIHHTGTEHHYTITPKKIVETREANDITTFAFGSFPQIASISSHPQSSPTVIAKDIMTATHEYEILDTSMESHLQCEDSNQIEISKQSDFLTLQHTNEHQITLPPRTLLNHAGVGTSKMLIKKTINKSHESKSQHSQEILQNNTVYSQPLIQTNTHNEPNLFETSQYFETKFAGLPNEVLNLEHKIDVIKTENISHSISNRSNSIITTEALTQSSLICETENSLHQIQLANSQPSSEADGTENITPSIGQLHDETTIHSNSRKSNMNGIATLRHNEVEFSDPEDMLEGIRGVVDKVQESFDTGDEMDAMSPPRNNWFPVPGFNGDINSKTVCDSTRYETITPVENFQMFFKNDESNDIKKEDDTKFSEPSDDVVIEQQLDLIVNGTNTNNKNSLESAETNENYVIEQQLNIIVNRPRKNKNNQNSLVSADNSLSSTTNTVRSNLEIGNDMSMKMEDISCDFENSCSDGPFKPFGSLDEPVDSPSQVSNDETFDNCGILSTNQKEKYVCPECGKTLNSKNSLKYHVYSHTGQRPFPCKECGKSFYARNALITHLRVHSGERPFVCPDCGRAFRQWGDLNYHKESLHTEQKKYQCEFCGKAFARRYSLVIHRRIHTLEKNYKCEFCSKTFRASSYLQNHRKIHTGEKPHECPICKRRFRVGGDLRRHMNTHEKKGKTTITKSKVTERILDMNIQPQENHTFTMGTSNNIQTDLNSLSTPNGNLDQLLKTDNITSKNIKNTSPTAWSADNSSKNNNNLNKKKQLPSSTSLSTISSSSTELKETTNLKTLSCSTKNKKNSSKIEKEQGELILGE